MYRREADFRKVLAGILNVDGYKIKDIRSKVSVFYLNRSNEHVRGSSDGIWDGSAYIFRGLDGHNFAMKSPRQDMLT